MKNIHNFIIISLLALLASEATAQKKGIYPVAAIPASLMEADAIVRDYQIDYTVKSASQASMREKRVITIMNDQTYLNGLVIHYNSFCQVKEIRGKLYDANGKLIRKIDREEIKDYSAVSDFSIYEDSRVKFLEVNYPNYPYTVAFEYELEYKGIRNYPDWSPQFDYGIAVQNSAYRISLGKGVDMRHKANFDTKPAKSEKDGMTVYEWTTSNLKPVKEEYYSPVDREILPLLRVAPTVFSVDDYEGDMSTWKSFGNFIYKLNKGQDVLSTTMKEKVQSLIADAKTDEEKIAVLYQYLQKNTRYVSVQLGIGGWQSFDAKYVERNKYGDCKALTWFMKSMLQEAGVEAYPALIAASSKPEPIEASYSDSRFNHVILYVPGDDPTWLECTSSYDPPGHVGRSLANRKALLITPEGGQLIDTPKSESGQNTGHAKIEVALDEEGTAEVKVRSTKTGTSQEWHRYAGNSLSAKELREELEESLSELPSLTVTHQEIKTDETRPISEYHYDLEVSKLATIQGNRLFIRPNVIHQFTRVPDKEKERKQRIINQHPYTQKDEVEIALPTGYGSESIPETVSIDTDFGHYKTSCEMKDNKLFYQREFSVKTFDLPADRYQDMYDFYKKVKKYDRAKAVLIKKT